MVFENGKKLIYVVFLSIFGILVAFLLFYKKYFGDLEKIGSALNPYVPCVSNPMWTMSCPFM